MRFEGQRQRQRIPEKLESPTAHTFIPSLDQQPPMPRPAAISSAFRAICTFAIMTSLLGGGFAPAADQPSFGQIRAAVERHFAAVRGYERGDIISRSQVKSLLDELKSLGWVAADAAAILEAVPADDD